MMTATHSWRTIRARGRLAKPVRLPTSTTGGGRTIGTASAVVVAVAMALCATRALASGESGASNPFAGDIGNALWTLVIFGIVVLVLAKFAWGPILGALQKREDFIHDSLAQAKRDREEAEAKLKEYGAKLDTARDEATAVVEEGRRDAEVLRHKLEEQARAESQAMFERAKREIAIATETAVSQLYDLSGSLATDIASRILRKELDPKEHERLISESIDELRKTVEGNGRSP